MMKKHLFHLLALWLCLMLACGYTPALAAQDVFTIDIDALDLNRLSSDSYVQDHLSASTQGIRIRKYVSDSSELAAPIRLTLTQMDTQTVVLDRDCGYQSGTFDSGALYLPGSSGRTAPYLITLYVGNYVYAVPFMQTQARLSHHSACTVGPRLRDLDGALGGDWLMGTMLDLNALRSRGSHTVDICASNSTIIGSAHITADGNRLRVQLSFSPEANAEVHSQDVYLVTDCTGFYAAPAHRVGDWIDFGSASSALLYLPLQLSYDPSALPSFSYSSSHYRDQFDLWDDNRSSASHPESTFDWYADDWSADSSWSDWDSGWTDEDYGWANDWSSEAEGWAAGW